MTKKAIDHKDIDPSSLPHLPRKMNNEMREKIQGLMESAAEEAFDVIKDGLHDENVWARIKCADMILKKIIPDKTTKEIVGRNGGPIEVNATTKREFVLKIVDTLDKIDKDDIKEIIEEHGTLRLPESYARTETGEERKVEHQAPVRKRREES